MIDRAKVKVGDILLWSPHGAEEYHLMVDGHYRGKDGWDGWDEWTTINMTTGSVEEVSITDANSINWWRVA